MPGVASFHLVRERGVLRPMARLGSDRVRLRAVPGLRFWRLLGTGAGSRTGPGADPHRTALFAIWDDDGALDAFERRMAARWASSEEVWHVRLRGLGGHGRWHGVDVLGEIDAAPAEPPGAAPAPVAIITRAHVRRRAWRRFREAGDPVSEELQGAPGLLDVVGIGEAPVGRLGTFSLWRDLAAARAYATGMPRHRDVVRRTRAEAWYGEELFARFAPYASRGSWDGRDPLRGTGCDERTGASIP